VIDDDDLDGPFGGFQFQPKLLGNGCEDGRAVQCVGIGSIQRSIRPLQMEISRSRSYVSVKPVLSMTALRRDRAMFEANVAMFTPFPSSARFIPLSEVLKNPQDVVPRTSASEGGGASNS
jgi:hypothetical protein